jgi:hypothetical protein
LGTRNMTLIFWEWSKLTPVSRLNSGFVACWSCVQSTQRSAATRGMLVLCRLTSWGLSICCLGCDWSGPWTLPTLDSDLLLQLEAFFSGEENGVRRKGMRCLPDPPVPVRCGQSSMGCGWPMQLHAHTDSYSVLPLSE